MKTSIAIVVSAVVLASCLDISDRPNVSMIAESNGTELTTSDTLEIVRSIANSGEDDIWLNASAPSYEMTTLDGAHVCHTAGTPVPDPPVLVRIASSDIESVTLRYPLDELEACAPGTYSLVFVAHFRRSENAGDSFALRTSSSTFVLTAPPAP